MKTFTPKGNTVGMIMPVWIMQSKVSHGAKLLYALLCDYSGSKDHCWPSHSTLSKKLICSISSVKRYLVELVREKLIFIQKEKQTSSIYYMLAVLNKKQIKANLAKVKLTYPQSKLTYAKVKMTYESNLNNLILINTPPMSPIASRTDDLAFIKKKQKGRGHYFKNINADFENFWNQYPKKEGKELARTIWHKMSKTGKFPVLKELCGSLQYFCKTEGWQREQGRYVPQLVNWLKNMRWKDITPLELKPVVEIVRPQKAIKQPCLLKTELSKIKVLFEQFASYFYIPSQGIKSMAFGLWSFLHEKNIAPSVAEKQSDNIVTYLKNYKISMICNV